LTSLYELQSASGQGVNATQAQSLKAILQGAKPKPQGATAAIALLHYLGEVGSENNKRPLQHCTCASSRR
jgi:hypothetical protein